MNTERQIFVPTDDGTMETFIVHPDGNGPFPAVVMYQNVRGLGEQLREGARHPASAGYYCAAPDLYYRLGKVEFDPDGMDEYTKSVRSLAIESLLRAQLVVRDTECLLSKIAEDPIVRPGPRGAIGYCVGGYLAPLVAGALPDVFRATAAIHPIRLLDDAPHAPRQVLDKLQGEIYFGIAELDPGTPSEVVKEWTELLATNCQARWQVEVHPQTQHGFSLPGRSIYDEAAANLVWERVFAMFARTLH